MRMTCALALAGMLVLAGGVAEAGAQVPQLVQGGWDLNQGRDDTGAGQQYYDSGFEAAIYDACARHGCDGDQLIAVMYCESGGDPYAVNPWTGDYGLFQINLNVWGPITDPYAQIEFAAQKFAAGEAYLWLCA